MPELIHTHSAHVTDTNGRRYEARIYGAQEVGGSWIGWLEFRELDPERGYADAPVRRTDRETTQPDRTALEYWAGGIEPIYLDGAFARATVTE
jgi:hypothetical protein